MPHSIQELRNFLKDDLRQIVNFSNTHQNQGIAPPPIEKPSAPDAPRIDLIPKEAWRTIGQVDVRTAMARRKSYRKFQPGVPLSLEELSFLLWATQGIREHVRPGVAFRTVPSAGARHPFETYVYSLRVDGMEPGVYRYLPVEQQLVFEFAVDRVEEQIIEATLGQTFSGEAAVNLIWAAVPYRTEWRYDIASHKVIAIDAGHVCQNLYLACEAIGAGTCAIAAYDQKRIDQLMRLDGNDEFVIYLAPVGKV